MDCADFVEASGWTIGLKVAIGSFSLVSNLTAPEGWILRTGETEIYPDLKVSWLRAP